MSNHTAKLSIVKSMWVATGDWEGGHGYLVAGASTHFWEMDSSL